MVDKSIDYCSSRAASAPRVPRSVKVTEIIHHRRTAMKRLRHSAANRLMFYLLIGTMMTPVAIAELALDVKPIRLAMERPLSACTARRRRAPTDAPSPWFKPLPNSGTRPSSSQMRRPVLRGRDLDPLVMVLRAPGLQSFQARHNDLASVQRLTNTTMRASTSRS